LTKSEREELRRLLRARFKVLRADVAARQTELEAELADQIEAQFRVADKAYDDLMFKLKMIVDDANRQANDICRELWGREQWGEKTDRAIIGASPIDKPGRRERATLRNQGTADINRRVRAALVELERQENALLTDLAVTALESAEAQGFFAGIPSVSELVPSYRLKELTR
jgi:hypothetical protein